MTRSLFTRAPLSAAVILLTGSLTAHAVEEVALDKVTVSGTRSETVQLPLATSITVIDAEQIRQSGATQVSEVLRLQAGIQLQDLDGSGGRNVTIGMRGFTANAANNTLVLVDGRRLNNASLAAPALNTIAIKDIERIEIVQGSAGVLYGDQAVGGVINVITKRATKGELNGSLQVLGGSDDLQSYTASVNQGFDNGLSYNLSAQKRKADNYRDNNKADIENVFAGVRYDFTGGFIFADGQHVDDELGLPGNLSDAAVKEDRRQTRTPNDYADQKTETWRVGGGVDLGSEWQLLAEYADREDKSESSYSDSVSHQVLRSKNFTPRLVGTLGLNTGNAIVTLGYDRNDAEYSSASAWGGNDTEQKSDGIYGQLVLPFTTALTATLGARYSNVEDIDNLTGDNHKASLNAQEYGLNYQFTPAFRVFARYAEGFRFANADENAYTLFGVDYLQPQTSESAELGVAWDGDRISTSLTAYQMDVDNEIMYDAFNYANINLPASERQGVIVDATLVITEQLSIRTNYTWTDAELSSGDLKGNAVPFVAENTANLGLVFKPLDSLTTSLDASYTGSRYRVGDDLNNAAKVKDVTLLNANIIWALVENVELGLRVKNITDETYSDYQGVSAFSGNYQYPQPGRTWNASVSWYF